MKRLIFVALIIFMFVPLVFALPGSAKWRLVWDPNSEPDLAGYRVYWSLTSGKYNNADMRDVGNVTEQLLSGLPLIEGNVYYFVLTAYDTSQNESDFSAEVKHLWDQTAPAMPVNFKKELVIQFE